MGKELQKLTLFDPIYSGKYFNRVNGNDGSIDSGPFKDFKVFYYHGENDGKHCLRCKKASDKKLDHTLFSKLARNIEGLTHGHIHNNIGHKFSSHASSDDPLFCSHYAFIDKYGLITKCVT
ncbi:hypothetical protein K502DRAFT_352072 [Neoconidiobolus thromboides FSU 785]|nr:hypothetical protein K502DRAFT_352072 [Neoconidiobolus thromboides FSU 785]